MVGERLVIGLVFDLLGIDGQLTRRKLGKKIHPDHGGRQRPTAAMVTPPRRRIIRQSPNMIRDKSMSLKLDNIIVYTINKLFKDTAHRRRVMPVFDGCGSCRWTILADKTLRRPISVPLTVVSARRNRGGQ